MVKLNHNHIFEGGTLITNFTNDREDLYQRAIDKFESIFGYSTLEICRMATTGDGQVLHNHSSLHSANGAFPLHIEEFWEIFNNLRVAA